MMNQQFDFNQFRLINNPTNVLKQDEVDNLLKDLQNKISEGSKLVETDKAKHLNLEFLLLNSNPLKQSVGLIEKPQILAIDQIYAATVNSMRDIDMNLVNSFLGNQGVNISQVEKSVVDLRSSVRTNYDLKKQVNVQTYADKFSSKDKFTRVYQTRINSLREDINELFRRRKVNLYQKTYKMEKESGYKSSPRKGGEEKISGFVLEPLQVTPLKSHTGVKNKTDSNLNELNTKTDYLNLKNEDEKSLTLFDTYFESLKIYFYYEIKKEILPESAGFLLSSLQIQKFNSEKSNQSLFYPVTVTLNALVGSFRKDYARQSIFSLLLTMLDPASRDQSFSLEKLLGNSLKFYEERHLERIINNGKSFYNPNIIDEKTKLKLVDEFVRTFVLKRVQTQGFDTEFSKLLLWGTIYTLIRSGLIQECLKFMTNSQDQEVRSLSQYFIEFSKENLNLDEQVYLQVTSLLRNKNELMQNPFRHACLSLFTKVNSSVPEFLFESMEDHLWFHVKLCHPHPSIQEFKKKAQTNNLSYLNLKAYQEYILRTDLQNLEKHSNIHLDYCRLLFSLLLFEDGLNHLYKNSHYLDACNISILLSKLNLNRSFSSLDMGLEKIESLEKIPKGEKSQTKILLDSLVTNFMRSKFLEIFVYVKTAYNDTEKLAQLFLQTGIYFVLLSTDTVFFTIGSKKMTMKDIMSPNEIRSLVELVVEKSLQVPSKSKENFSSLIKLASEYQLIPQLLYLIISDCIEVITQKTPRKLFKSDIHSKPSVHNPSKIVTDTKISEALGVKHRANLTLISSRINQTNEVVKNNYKYQRQLETIEEIYEKLNKSNTEDSVQNCLELYMKSISLIPFKSDTEIRKFITDEYNTLFEGIQNIIPDISYLAFFLISSRVKFLSSLHGQRNENLPNHREELAMYKNYLNNLNNLLEGLKGQNAEKNSSRLKTVCSEINNFTLKN